MVNKTRGQSRRPDAKDGQTEKVFKYACQERGQHTVPAMHVCALRTSESTEDALRPLGVPQAGIIVGLLLRLDLAPDCSLTEKSLEVGPNKRDINIEFGFVFHVSLFR